VKVATDDLLLFNELQIEKLWCVISNHSKLLRQLFCKLENRRQEDSASACAQAQANAEDPNLIELVSMARPHVGDHKRSIRLSR